MMPVFTVEGADDCSACNLHKLRIRLFACTHEHSAAETRLLFTPLWCPAIHDLLLLTARGSCGSIVFRCVLCQGHMNFLCFFASMLTRQLINRCTSRSPLNIKVTGYGQGHIGFLCVLCLHDTSGQYLALSKGFIC